MPELADKVNLIASPGAIKQNPKDTRVKITLNSDASLPIIPPDVLWAWLEYYYQQTGQWFLPPSETKKTQPPNESPNESLSVPSSDELTKQTKTKSVKDDFSNQATTLAYQFPLPSMLAYAPIAPAQLPLADKSGLQTTNYKYTESVYFSVALELIRKHDKNLLFGSQLVLSLIIAWSKFPLFNNGNNRQGNWITLSIAQIARELRIRTSNLKLYIEELENNGFIETGTVNDKIVTRREYEQLRQDCTNLAKDFGIEAANLWKPRAIQEKTLFYRLKIASLLDSALPVFNPFKASSVESESERLTNSFESLTQVFPHIQPIRQDVKPDNKPEKIDTQVLSERQQDNFSTLSKSFLHEHDSNHVHVNIDKDKILNLKHDSAKTLTNTENNFASSFSENLLLQLTSEQKLKFDFLDNQATFANFSRSDGRVTLDSQQAFKFALNTDLSLERVKELYNLVKTCWEKGECRKNPLGLLHWSLSRNCEPFANPQVSYTKSYKQPAIANSMFHVNRDSVVDSQNNRSVRLSRPKKSRRTQPVTQPDYTSVSQNRIPDTAGLFEVTELEPTALWSTVVTDDLAGRFRFQPEQIQLLEDSRLELTSAAGSQQVTVVLRSELEERQLNLATRNTIELALRQRLGAGYRYVFQAANAY